MAKRTYTLAGGTDLITNAPDSAFRVLTGTVIVYIVPVDGKGAGRRVYLCEVHEGSSIPAFCYRDANYQEWRFCLAALEEAAIEEMPEAATTPLRKRFAHAAGVVDEEEQGYNDSLVNYYRMGLVREDGYFIRTRRESDATAQKTNRLLASVFRKDDNKGEETGTNLYRTIAYACKQSGVDIADFDRIQATYGKNPTIEDIARASHFPYRKVILTDEWYKCDSGPFVGILEETGEPVACIPKGQHRYVLYSPVSGTRRLTKREAAALKPEAYSIYRPLPQGGVTGRSLVQYCLKGLSRADIVGVLALTVVSSLIGLLIPSLNQALYDRFIPIGNMNYILQIGFLIMAFMVGNVAFSIVKNLCSFRLGSRIQCQVQNAMYYRVFELPESFFRKYESADLAKRIMELGELVKQVADLAIAVAMNAVMGAFYLLQMFRYSSQLATVSLVLTASFCIVIYIFSRYQMRYEAEVLRIDGKSDSTMYQLLEGIEKVRMAGIENRAIYEYMKPFVEQRRLETKIGKLRYIGNAIIAASGSASTIVLYLVAYNTEALSIGTFVAFTSAFGMLTSAAHDLTTGLVNYKMLQPAYERVKDALETATEVSAGSRLPEGITGRIDLDHVTFAYDEDTPAVIDDLSLHIEPGENIGIVGMSGCGKSTLLKLLLGFERPTGGKIYFDDQDSSELDIQELRRNFGVVLQDGDLISGSIYENIELTCPGIGIKAVNQVVTAVGLKPDIDQMPMGLFTMVSEGAGTLSGGQKQRILIARALISKPKIIFFDEATSALDNITQKMVGDALEQLDSTKIVVAHRLSTIENCDRIIVLDKGRIAQDGTYEQLMETDGIFSQLAQRQLI